MRYREQSTKFQDKLGSKKRSGSMQAMANLMPRVTKKILGNRGFAEASIITEWTSIIGEEMAQCSQPEKLVFEKGARASGVLHIRVTGGGAAELQHIAPQVMERINGYFGYKAVARLKYIHIPLTGSGSSKRKYSEDSNREIGMMSQQDCLNNLESIGHFEMRKALERLGKAIKLNRHRKK